MHTLLLNVYMMTKFTDSSSIYFFPKGWRSNNVCLVTSEDDEEGNKVLNTS